MNMFVLVELVSVFYFEVIIVNVVSIILHKQNTYAFRLVCITIFIVYTLQLQLISIAELIDIYIGPVCPQTHPFYLKPKQSYFKTYSEPEGILTNFVCRRVNSCKEIPLFDPVFSVSRSCFHRGEPLCYVVRETAASDVICELSSSSSLPCHLTVPALILILKHGSFGSKGLDEFPVTMLVG